MLAAMPDLRIISLVPSATETVCRLGLAGALVGRSHVCNFPREVTSLPILTRPELAKTSSLGIHKEVRARLSEGLAIFDVDLEKVRALAPTHLLVQDQCSVCAVSPTDLEQALAEWLDPAPVLVRLAPHQLADVWADIETIGLALGKDAAAAKLCQTLSHRLSDLAEAAGKTQATMPGETARPRVACIEWLDPIMIAGHWVPELIRLAGGEPVLARTGGPSATVQLAELEQASPDIIVVQPCGFDLPATQKEWAAHPHLHTAFSSWHGSDGLPVRVALADGDAYFNRPGPRLVESAEVLGEILHPAAAEPIHRDHGWIRLSGFESR
jgi:iron complex transport system substrate-binding protein